MLLNNYDFNSSFNKSDIISYIYQYIISKIISKIITRMLLSKQSSKLDTNQPLLQDENIENATDLDYILNRMSQSLQMRISERFSFNSNEMQINSHLPQNNPTLTIFLMLNTMIGSGILNQPYVFKASGIIGAFLLYFIATLMTWIGLMTITIAGIKVEIYDYGNLTKYALGRFGEILLESSIVITCFGALLGYILVVGSTLSDLLISWMCNKTICQIYGTTIISVICFVTPVCLFRHFGHLALLSIFSIFAIVCVLGLVIIGGPIVSKEDHNTSGSNNHIEIISNGVFSSIGSIIFALSCCSGNFHSYITTVTTHQNRSSWFRITLISILLGTSMCIIMGLAGYLSFRENTNGIILENFQGHQFDFFKVMVVLHLILYIPVDFVIMRYSIVKLILNKKSEDLSSILHIIITISLLCFTTSLICLLNAIGLASGDAFSLILDITGGISGSIISFIIPTLVYLKICDRKDNFYYPAMITLILGFLVIIASIVTTILQV